MINTLSLITSMGCSLHCKYCRLAAQEEQFKNFQMQQKTVQALEDGTFLKNVKQTLEYFDIMPENIAYLAFWGMEPTLTLRFITEHISDWFELFPNWTHCFFSTNGQQNYQDIYNFAIAASQYSKSKFQLKIQVSYDGPVFMDNNRQAKYHITKLEDRLIDLIKQKEENNFFIHLYTHSVFNNTVLNYLFNYSDEQLNDYYSLQYQYNLYPIELDYIKCKNDPDYGFEMPHNYTKEESQKLFEFINRLINSKYDIVKANGQSLLYTLSGKHIWKSSFNKCLELKDWVTLCGNYTSGLFIRYDGTIMNCTNTIFTDKDINDERSKINYFWHIGNQTNPDFYNYFWDTINNKSCQLQYNTILKSMDILAQMGEIDQAYLIDLEKKKRHALYALGFNSCPETYFNLTHTFILTPFSHIRLIGNGIGDLIDEQEKQQNGTCDNSCNCEQ